MTAKRPPKEAPVEAGAPPESREQMIERKRANARRRREEDLERLRSTVTGSSDATSGRLRGVPRAVETNWEITASDIASFDRSFGVTKILDDLGSRVHPADRMLVFNGLAAAFSFHDLTKVIGELEYDDGMEDVAYELRRVRVGFELAMQVLDRVLSERGIALDARSSGGKNKREPEWWDECAERAQQMLATGTDPRDLVGILKKRFRFSDKAIRKALKEKGLK